MKMLVFLLACPTVLAPFTALAQPTTICNGAPCPRGACVQYPDGTEFCASAIVEPRGAAESPRTDLQIKIPNASPQTLEKVKELLRGAK